MFMINAEISRKMTVNKVRISKPLTDNSVEVQREKRVLCCWAI